MKGKNLGKRRTPEQRERLKGRNHFRTRIVRTCEHCGQSYERRGKTAHSGLRFCSSKCWYAWLREEPERHPTWKGGYQPYYGPNWRHQARLARERDGQRCRSCGKAPKKQSLEVHHIRAFRLFPSWRKANGLRNLVTLCKSCHARDGGKDFSFQPVLS